MSHSKEQMLKDLIEETVKVDLQPKTGESVVDKHQPNAVSKQGFLEGHQNIQEQGSWSWKKYKWLGNENNDEIIPTDKTKRCDAGRVRHKNVYFGEEDMGADGSAFSI